MSRGTEERVEHALSQLLERLLPQDPHEDEAVADERFEEAFHFANSHIGSAGEPSVISDVNHASDLIKRKLLQGSSPAKALRYQNLYSRLLAQPVLSQKWAMLYFLYQLSDYSVTNGGSRHPNLAQSGDLDGYQEQNSPNFQKATPKKSTERDFVVDSPAFNEAFSNAGLLRLPGAEEQGATRATTTGKREKIAERPKKTVVEEDVASPQMTAGAEAYANFQPSESVLLRDLPFTLQGLSSTNLEFTSLASLKLPATLPVPIVSLLHTLAEPSLLYKCLSQFVESSEGGLVGQSFRSALGLELRSYLGLVATLEGQIRRALLMLHENQVQGGIGKAGVTLKRCVIWTREATMGLRLMSMMVEQSKGKKGGELIKLIHSFSLTHGDPFVGAFAERILSHATRPFYDMLRQWIYDGELSDPYEEFFVSEQHEEPTNNDNKGGAMSVWEDKYKVKASMVPTIVTEDFANKVFLIGKSLNFIRTACGDSAWVESYSKSASRELRYGDTANLERSIGEAYKTTMARLVHLMADKFKLFDHLQALKRYLLLGAGDFIAILMESLAPNLDRPANTQYRHTLTAQLEHAVRSSNAQHDSPDVLRRLDSRMLELSHGEIGWDVFTLEYKIDTPVDVIVTPHGSKQYLKVFNFLWRVKRVEFALGSTWRRCVTGARGVLGAVSDTLGDDWKKARCVVAEMIHFINQLQYYILFEVIEASWSELQASLRKTEATLDDMIEAHAKYLKNITRKGLLGSQTTDFPSQLHEILKLVLAYKDVVDGLYSYSVAEFTKRQEIASKIEMRTARGEWGVTEKDAEFASPTDSMATPAALQLNRKNREREMVDTPLPPPGLGTNSGDDDMLPALRKRLKDLGDDFKKRVEVLLGDLVHQPDADMRWLAMVMNFNDVYQPVRRRRRRDEKKA